MTFWFEFIVTVHPAVPLHAPDHPTNAKSAGGLAVRLTVDPAVKFPTQLTVGQLIPGGELVTEPLPAFDTDRVFAVF